MSKRAAITFGHRELASLEALLQMELNNAEPEGKYGREHMRRVRAMHQKALLALQKTNTDKLGVHFE